jgi:hypothetical protein
MKNRGIVEGEFTWYPHQEIESRFGGSRPPSKPELRKPLLWLARDGNDLYFVNISGETLDSVIADSGGFQTADDTVISVTSNTQYEYKNVINNAAVKIEEYDGHYDLDYLLQASILIKSKSLGCIQILSPCEKGGVGETVLLWDTGESGKNVNISPVPQD